MSWINNLTESSQFVFFSALKIIGVFAVLMFIVAYAVWVERKLSAAIQDRRGPDRFGDFFLLQPPAAEIKAFLKQEFPPAPVPQRYFSLAAALALNPALAILADHPV